MPSSRQSVMMLHCEQQVYGESAGGELVTMAAPEITAHIQMFH